MPRGLTPDQRTAAGARIKGLAVFVEVLTTPTAIRAWSGVGSVTALGQSWAGLGDFGIVNGLGSDRRMTSRAISVGLNGLPGDLIPASVLAETRGIAYRGKPMTVYLGFTHVETGALLSDPTAIWSGVADVAAFKLGAEISVELPGEHYASHMRRVNGLRMTTESHNQRLGNPTPRDLFFEHQSRLMGAAKPLL